MSFRCFLLLSSALTCTLLVGSAHAQCSKDTDCKGDRVCEQGACVAPDAARSAPRYEEEPRRHVKRRGKRHSTGMMVGGIVMVSVAPIAFVASYVSSLQRDSCQRVGSFGASTSADCSDYDAVVVGGVVVGIGLLAAGIPLIVIGAKREPLRGAFIGPWAAPGGAGLSLRLTL